MKKLLLIGTALLSATSYVSALNPDQDAFGTNSASERNITEHSTNITPSDPVNDRVKIRWENLTKALTDINISKSQFELSVNEIKEIYTQQKLNPKLLNEAIRKLFSELSLKIKIDEPEKGKIDKNWKNLIQQFPGKLALLINQDLHYESISNEEADKIFNFLLNPPICQDYEIPYNIHDLKSIYFDLLYYASSIFRDELTQDKNFTFLFHWDKFKTFPLYNLKEFEIAIILPYLEKAFPLEIDQKNACSLVKEILCDFINWFGMPHEETPYYNNVTQQQNASKIVSNILQSLKNRGFIDVLVFPSDEQESIIKKILNEINLLKNNETEQGFSSVNKTIVLHEYYKMIINQILETGSSEAKKEVIINCVGDGSEFLNKYPDDDLIFRDLSDIIVSINNYIDNYEDRSRYTIILNPLSYIDPLIISNYVQGNIMKPLQNKFKGEKLQNALGFIKNWINKTQEILDDQIEQAINQHIESLNKHFMHLLKLIKNNAHTEDIKEDFKDCCFEQSYWEQQTRKLQGLKELKEYINKEIS